MEVDLTDQQMRELNATGVERLARARGIPRHEASAWLSLALQAFRRDASRPDYREMQKPKQS